MEFSLVFLDDFVCLIPELFLVLGASLLLFYGATYCMVTNSSGLLQGPVMLSGVITLSSFLLFLAGVLSFHGYFEPRAMLYGSLLFDNLSFSAKTVMYFAGSFCLLNSYSYLRRQELFAFEYSVLVVLSCLGLSLLLSSYNFLSFYLALEMQALALYVLASFKRGSAYSTEAGLKYFIVGAFSSGLLLFGISVIYAFTGTVDFENLGRLLLEFNVNENLTIFAGFLFISAGLFFKLAIVPFHMWAPDVYEGAPTSVSLFFSVVPKMPLFVILVRFYFVGFYGMVDIWQNILIVVSFSSLVLAALSTLYQRKIKRFFVYSSIGHVGYMLIGFSACSLEGLQALFFYLVIYMVMSFTVWSLLMCLLQNRGSRSFSNSIKYLDELAYVVLLNPAVGVTLGVAMFSMGGIPPLAGFYAKLLIFFSAMESSLYVLALCGVLTSVISAFYYLRLVKLMFFDNSVTRVYSDLHNYRVFLNRGESLLLSCGTFLLLFLIVNPSPLLVWSHLMAVSIS